MVAIVTGKGTGLERSSAFVLGSQGQLGSSLQGRGGDGVFVNAASGNLLITRQDEFLIGLGPDAAVSRTYNSLATVGDGDNNDKWQAGLYRRIIGTAGSATVTRVDWDGSETIYTQVSGNNYICKEGDGAYDTLSYSTGTSEWTWQDGDSRIRDIYNSSGKLTSTRDLDGNALTYTYTGSLITRVTTQNGEYTNLTYNGSNQLTALVTYYDSTHITRVFYEYEAGTGLLSKVQVNLDPTDNNSAGSYETNYTYVSGTSRVATIGQSDGSLLSIGYTLVGSDYRVTSLTQTVVSGVTRSTTLSYDTTAGTTTITDNAGNVVKMRYDSSGQLTSITYPPATTGAPAQTMSFAYNANGDVVSRTDALGRVVNYTYDSNGNMLSSQDAAGNRIERTWGSNNELLTETRFLAADPDGAGSNPAGTPVVTRYIYDGENHLRFVVTADGKVTEYGYDAPGQQTSAVSYTADKYTAGTFTETALASWASLLSDRSTVQRTDTTYSARGQIATITRYSAANSSGVGLTTSDYSRDTYTYDQAGQLRTHVNNASSATESYVYDGLMRVTSSTDLAGASTTFAFNDAATTTTITLANNLSRISVYNKAGELLTYTESGSDVTTAVTTNKYDNLGRLRMVTDATSRTVYLLYDNSGRKVADIGPDGAVTEYRYDAANNVTSTTRYATKLTTGPGSQLASLVDGSGNPANVALSSIRPSTNAGDDWTFSLYDDANRLVQSIDGTGATSVFTYDGASQLVSTKSYANRLSSSTIADLKAEAQNPNFWANPNNATLWMAGNLTATATGSQIDGSDAYKFSVITGGSWEAFVGSAVTAIIGDTVSLTLSIMGVGSVTNAMLGLYGDTTGWGSPTIPTTAAIASGPGTLTQTYGIYGYALWNLTGLSTTTATRFTITRKMETNDPVRAYFYLKGDYTTTVAGDSMIAAAPVFTRSRSTAAYLPTVDSARDRLTRNFYDNDGRLIGTLDGAGGLSRIFYDEAGRKIREIGYATAAASGLRAGGTLTELTTSVGTSCADRRVDYVYDGRGFLRFKVNAAAHPTEYLYDTRGNVVRTIDYAGSITSAGSYSMASVQAGLTSAGLVGHASNRISSITYDAAGRAAFTFDALGGVVATTYDNVGRVVKQLAFVLAYTAADQSLGTMQTWAAAHAADTDNRLIRNIYDKAGHLTYVVDGETYITWLDRDAAGRVTKERRYDGTFTVTDSDTKTSLAATLAGVASGAWTDTTYTYDGAGRVTDTTIAYGTSDAVTTHNVYDALDRITDVTVAYGTSDASTLHRVFDAAGRITSEVSAYGTGIASTTGYAYDGVGNLLTRTDALLHDTTYTYDNMGRVLTATVPVDADPANNILTTNEYNALGELVRVIDARNYSTYSYYNALGQLTLQVDAELYATATTYTTFGEVSTVTRYAARTTSPAPTVTTPPTIVTGSLDATTSFLYDRRGFLTRVTDAEGYHEDYTPNTFNEREGIYNKAGGLSALSYDRRGLELRTYVYKNSYRPDGTLQASSFFQNIFVRDSRGNVATQYEAYGLTEQRITVNTYNRANRLTQVTHEAVTVTANDMSGTSSVAPVENYSYNLRGQLIQSIDAAGGKTTIWYDALGHKTDMVNAVGTLTHWTYDANGNALTMRAYDTAVSIPGSPPSATPPAGTGSYREVSYTYDWANRLSTTTVANLSFGVFDGTNYVTTLSGNNTTRLYYDKGGNVVATTIVDSGIINWTWYDGLGHKVGQIDGENYLTLWQLDANGNVVSDTRYASKITGSFGFSTAYYSGLLALVTPNTALDRTTTFTYDRNGKRKSERRWYVDASTVSGTGALSTSSQTAIVQYTYTALGLVETRQEANGDLTTYEYDTFGRLKSTKGATFVDHMGSAIRLQTDQSYDGFDRLVRTAQHGNVEDYEADRITTSTYVKDRLSQATDAAGFTHYFGYDVAGRVVQDKWTRTKSDGTTTVTEATNYRYDAAGRLIIQANATWNGSAWVYGEATRILYNAHGEVTGKGITASPTSTAVYQETFEYDAAGRMWRTNSGDGSLKIMFYDKAGNATMTLATVAASTGTGLGSYTITGALATINSSTGLSSIADTVTAISVYNKRGQQTASREPGRQLSYNGSSFTTANLVNSRAYNAYGEVLSETDARGYTTDFSYNTMGRLIQKQSPSVSTTSESGSTTSARPTETYYYDISGRMVGVRDANNNLTTRALEAGSGHDGTEAIVHAEYHADGGQQVTWHNVFGNDRVLIDELGQWEVRGYDTMGRVTEVDHRGGLLNDFYTYDALGQRTRHINSQLGSSVVERTDYDLMGRVSAQIDFAGGTTSYAYSWNGAIATTGLGTFGGYTKTTTNMAALSSTESLDYFGRTVARTDYGAHSYSYSFDLAGRLVTETGVSGQTQSYAWLNSGRLYQLVDTAGTGKNVITAKYGYDENGNRTYEGYSGTVYSFKFPSGTTSATETLQNATIAYDALGRITTFTDKDAGGTTRITVTTSYDLAGNIRRVQSTYPDLAYPAYPAITTDKWFRYDNMNRMVTVDGMLSGGTIVRSATGYDVTYDIAGRRATQTKDAGLTGQAWTFIWFEGHGPGSGGFEEYPEEGVNGNYGYVNAFYYGARREEYGYNADGSLATVKFAETGYTDNYDGSVTSDGVIGAGVLRGQYTRDAMQRITRYQEFDAYGSTVTYDRYDIAYDARNNVTAETLVQKKVEGATNTYVTYTTNSYTSDGRLSSTAADQWKNGSDSAIPDTSMSYSYSWYDGARIGTTTYDKDTGSGSNPLWTSTYNYDGVGRVASVAIDDDRDRTVSFAYAPEGQILNRRERSAATNNPQDQRYFVNGQQVGEITSDGNNDPSLADYAQNLNYIRNWTPNPQLAPFRWNTSSGVTRGTFGPSAGYDVVNPYSNGAQSTSANYQVRDGETLQSIAQSAWGDASLWYLIADANGLSAGSQLVAGQSLILPDRVTNAHNNSDTFRVYDPNGALGDLSPTSAKPPKKPGACAVVGQILMVAIAVGVSIWTGGLLAGPASAALGSVGGAMAAGAVAGAAGSIASQAFGVATGLQDKFNWGGVAMAALGGAIGGGLGKAGGIFGKSGFVGGAARGLVGSMLTQGIGVATGLQDKFDWAGVAAAGLGGGLGAAIGGGSAGDLSLRGIATQLGASLVSGVANAGLRSAITGTSFGDNLIAALPDVIGGTIGNVVGGALQRAGGSTDYEGDGVVSGHEESDSYANAVLAAATAAPLRAGDQSIPAGDIVVRTGDTVQSLAARYGIPASRIADLNHISVDATLRPGRRLFIAPDFQVGLDLDEQATIYARDFNGLHRRWNSLTPAQRRAEALGIINRRLVATGIPGITGFGAKASSDAPSVYQIRTHTIDLDMGLFRGSISLNSIMELAKTIYHEARHAEQYFRVLQLHAGRVHGDRYLYDHTMTLTVGTFPARVVADAAFRRPAQPGHFAESYFRAIGDSYFGPGTIERNDVLSHPVTANTVRYRNLPEEQDSWRVEQKVQQHWPR